MATGQTHDEYGNPIEDFNPLKAPGSAGTPGSLTEGGFNTGIAGTATPGAMGYVAPPSVTQAWTRQNVSETLSRYGAATQANLLKAIAENPWLGTAVGGGKIQDTQAGGTGRTWDVIGNLADASGATTHWQTLTGNTARAAAAAAAAARPGATVAPTVAAKPALANASESSALSSQQSQDSALRQQLINQLLQRAQQGLGVDRNDPAIRMAADANAANQERARRNYLSDIAEQAGPLANLRGEQRMAAERVGQQTGAYEADLVLRQQTAKRAEIAEALSSLGGLITAGQEMSLRKELAMMDDAINRLKLQQDSSQFNADLGYRNRALDQSGAQFNTSMGYNYDTFDWDRSPLNPRNMPQV